MAVLLCREGERKSQAALPPEDRSLPRVTVRNQPVSAAPHWSGRLRARTPEHIAYAQPEREQVWREKFERRQVQQTACGFHGPAYKPYRGVGHVELDDPTLILGGLNQKQDGQTTRTAVSSPPLPSTPPITPPPPRPTLRSMASKVKEKLCFQDILNNLSLLSLSLFRRQLPDHLALLSVEMGEVEGRKEEVKVGRGLFESLKRKERAKAKAIEKKELADKQADKGAWELASVTFDPLRLAKRRTSTQMERQMSTVTFDPLSSSHDNRKIMSHSERRGTNVTFDPREISTATERTTSAATFDNSISSSHGNQTASSQDERAVTFDPENRVLSTEASRRGAEGEEGSGVCVSGDEWRGEEGEGEGELGDGGVGEGDSRDILQQSELVHQWYRQLCVLLWVMDGLKLDSSAQLTPFAKCWQLKRSAVHPVIQSRTLSRKPSPSKAAHNFIHWKDNAPSKHDSSPRAPHDINPLHSQKDGHMTSPDCAHYSAAYRRRKREAAIREEEKMRRQKTLTPAQMEALVTTVEEELNFSKRANRSRMQRIQQQTELARKKALLPSLPSAGDDDGDGSRVCLDVERVQEQFMETEQTKAMIVHHQLSAMDRHRGEALEQRLVSLQARHNLRQDLALMRRGVEIESTGMARKKLLMNFQWYPDLLSRLPDEVKIDRYCQKLLDLLAQHAQYSEMVGPRRWSKTRLINILSTLRPWELQSPETAASVEFLIQHVIYILPEDYKNWLDYHTFVYAHKKLTQNTT